MKRHMLAVIFMLLTAVPSSAQETRDTFDVGGDSFLAGRDVTFDRSGREDLFAAGSIVRGQSDIAGSAHMAGRKVMMTGAVGGDAYLAGMDVSLEGDVTGNVTVAGYDVSVAGVGGNLRISGGNLSVLGPVSGYALVSGRKVRIGGEIAGDAVITARDLTFAEGARVDGTLTLFEEDPGTLDVPDSVAPEGRIERRDLSEWQDATKDMEDRDWRGIVTGFLTGVMIVAVLASLGAVLVPQRLAALRISISAHPFRALLFGFLTQAALIGTAILLFVIVIGSFANAGSVFAALIAGAATILLALVAVLWGMSSRPMPSGSVS